MKLINWLKKLRHIVADYDEHHEFVRQQLYLDAKKLNSLRDMLTETNDMMRERTEIHADIPHFRGYPCTVVVAGRYKNNDYVQIYQITPDDFGSVVDHVKDMARHAQIKTVDAPFQLREYIRKEMK